MAHRSIAGSRAIVTGASGGIGRLLALALARDGANLVVVARRADELAQLASEVRSIGRQCEIVVGDVTDPAVRLATIERARTALGGLDILVNNAGIGAQGTFLAATPERLRRVFEVNFFAAVELTRSALPVLATGRKPIIVNVSSILGHRGIPFYTEYCASKFALQGFSESLRAELAQQGIDVLVVSPGTTNTEFFDHLIDSSGEMPWGELTGDPPERVVRAVVRAIARGRHEIVPSRRGRFLVWANRIAPWLVDWLMGRYGPPGR